MRWRQAGMAGAALLGVAQACAAGLSGPRTADGCLSVAGGGQWIVAEGRLTSRIFPGPPNYESIAAGDAAERAFILELASSECIDDGDEFADPNERFTTVHVIAGDEAGHGVAGAFVGRDVVVRGEAFASQNARHRAPLVLIWDAIEER